MFSFSLFDQANNQTIVRRQDYLSLFNYVVRNPAGFEIAWQYYTNNYRSIRANRLTARQMGTVANLFARYLFTDQQKKDFESFFVNHPSTDISATSLRLALETIDRNINWANTHRQTVFDWLRVKTL